MSQDAKDLARLLEACRLPVGIIEDLHWAADQQALLFGASGARWLELLAERLAIQNMFRLTILKERGFSDEMCDACGHHYVKHSPDPHHFEGEPVGCHECGCRARLDGYE